MGFNYSCETFLQTVIVKNSILLGLYCLTKASDYSCQKRFKVGPPQVSAGAGKVLKHLW